MAKSRLSLNPFRRLQWRLTLSYTLVTVGALLVVELVLLGLLLILSGSDFLAQEIVGTVEDTLPLRASIYLESSPRDIDGLNQWLQYVVDDSVAVSQEGLRLSRGFSIEFDVNYQLLVVDDEGVLIAQVSDSPQSTSPLGSSFDISSIPGLAPKILAANSANGANSGSNQLHVTNPDGPLVMALPIESSGGDILGTLIITMLMPAFNVQTLGSIAILILLSAIPITLAAGAIGTIFGFLTARGLTRRIESLSNTAEAWSQGDFSVMSADNSVDELGQLNQRLNRMAEQLQNLLQSHQELASIEERNRLARELHDSVKQQVFATTMQLAAAQVQLPDNPLEAQKHLDEAENLSRQSQEELAMLIQELRPAALQDDGLSKAIRNYTSDWSRQSGIEVELELHDELFVTHQAEEVLFRVTQEALSNIARHSEAKAVFIRLSSSNDEVSLTIRDDGKGFELSSARNQGYGLDSMRERADNVFGAFTIESGPGRGTEVVVRIPTELEV
jgi:NarL family two-component system sensor histidine kinase LiaS